MSRDVSATGRRLDQLKAAVVLRPGSDEPEGKGHYGAAMQARRNYAVLWCGCEGVIGSGGLELVADRVELSSSGAPVSLSLGDVRDARIARSAEDRLRGLPVLALRCARGGALRIASLEGTGALYEIAELLERAAPALRATGT